MSITGPHNNTFIIPKLSLGDTFKEWFDVTNTRIIEKLNYLKVYTATGIDGITANTDTSGELVIGIDTIIPGDHIFTGNITFNGQTTTINSTEVTIDDYILELGHTGASGETGGYDDSGIDNLFGGGGIRVLGADGNKEWIWKLPQNGWQTDENIIFGSCGDNVIGSLQNKIRIHETHLSGFSSGVEINFVPGLSGQGDNLLLSYNPGPSGGVIDDSAIDQHAIEISKNGFVDIKNGANRKRVYQVGHGFLFGTVVRKDFSSGYVKARADSRSNAEAVGIVSKVVNSDYFDVTFFGEVIAPTQVQWADSLVSGQGATLSPGDAYFLSPTNEGKLTINPPQTPGQVRKPLMVALSETSALVTNYIGHEIPNEVTAGAGGASNRVLITQVNNFLTGDIVSFDSEEIYGLSGASGDAFTGITYENGTYVRSQANTLTYSNVIGIVDEVNVGNDPNKFYITTNGRFTLDLDQLTDTRPANNPGTIGFTPGKLYYLDSDVSTYGSGQLTDQAPSTIGHFVKPVLVAIGANDGYFLNHLGLQNGASGGNGGVGSIQPLLGKTFYPIDRTLVVKNRTAEPFVTVGTSVHGLICFDELEAYIPIPAYATKCNDPNQIIVVDLRTQQNNYQNVIYLEENYFLSGLAEDQVPLASTTYGWTGAGCPVPNAPLKKIAIACDPPWDVIPPYVNSVDAPDSIVYDPDDANGQGPVIYGETFFYKTGFYTLECTNQLTGKTGTRTFQWRRMYIPEVGDAETILGLTPSVIRVNQTTTGCSSAYNFLIDSGCSVSTIITPSFGDSLDDGAVPLPPAGPQPNNPGDSVDRPGGNNQRGSGGFDGSPGWFVFDRRVTDQNTLDALNALPSLPIPLPGVATSYENDTLLNFYDKRLLDVPPSATHMLMTFIIEMLTGSQEQHQVHIKDYIQGDFYVVDWKVSERYAYGKLDPSKQHIEIQAIVPFNINQPRIMYAVNNIVAGADGRLIVSAYIDGFYISESGSGPGGGGNGRNVLCNGDFDFWERGVTLDTSTTSGLFVADRWRRSHTDGTLSSPNISQGVFDIASSSIPRPYSEYYIRFGGSLTSPGNDSTLVLEQRIEDVRTLAGNKATLSFYANGEGGNLPIYIALERNYGVSGDNGSGDSVEHIFVKNIQVSGGQWKKYTVTFDVPDFEAGSTAGDGSYISIQFYKHCAENKNGASNLIESNANSLLLSKVQLESGAIETAFAKSDRGIELQRCQRYYWNDSSLSIPASGNSVLFYPTTMYKVPTVTPYDGSVITSGVSTRSCVLTNTINIAGLRTGFASSAEI